MTHRDTTMLERLCRIAHEAIVRAILNELKQVDEGMVEAGRKKYFVPNHRDGLNGVIAGIFTSAIDQVLSQGE